MSILEIHHCKDHQSSGSIFAEHNCIVCKLKTKVHELEAELEHIDAAMVRRSALDKIPDRVGKIEFAIATAKRANYAEAMVKLKENELKKALRNAETEKKLAFSMGRQRDQAKAELRNYIDEAARATELVKDLSNKFEHYDKTMKDMADIIKDMDKS